MDPVLIALGCVIGFVTGLVPGLHVNLLAGLALLVASPEVALGLVAVGTVHTFVAILPATYLGVPAGDDLSVLPAHRMVLAGDGPAAIRLSVHASLVAAIFAVSLVPVYWWILMGPLQVAAALQTAAPLLLVLVPFWLALGERGRGKLLALLVAAMAAAIGLLSWSWPVQAWIGMPASPLLPLLSGLFGLPTLLAAMHSSGLPYQYAWSWRGLPGAGILHAIRAAGVAAATAVLPGLTAAVAGAAAMPRQAEPRVPVVVLSAVNTAHLVFAIATLWVLGRTRSGLAIAYDTLAPAGRWMVTPPADLIEVLMVIVIAGVFATVATIGADRLIAPQVHRVPPALLPGAAFAVVVALTLLATGWPGLLLLGAATAVGRLPIVLGVRRVHLVAALVWPIAWMLTH